MIKVNLSRINNMITIALGNARDLYGQICGARHNFNFEVLESTTDDDFASFKEKVDERKQSLENLIRRHECWFDYIGYLKTILNRCNLENGISQKLLEASILQQKISNKAQFVNDMRDWADSEIRQFKNMDYYKSAFTEKCRTVNLELYLYNSTDVNALLQEVEAMRKKLLHINDEIAVLNQTTTIDIMDFDEFESKNLARNKNFVSKREKSPC